MHVIGKVKLIHLIWLSQWWQNLFSALFLKMVKKMNSSLLLNLYLEEKISMKNHFNFAYKPKFPSMSKVRKIYLISTWRINYNQETVSQLRSCLILHALNVIVWCKLWSRDFIIEEFGRAKAAQLGKALCPQLIHYSWKMD